MEPPGSDLGTWSARRIVRNMFPLLVGLSVIVLWAGIRLEDAEALLEEYGLLAVMVPVMVGMGGNLGAIVSSRLTTRLHLGTTAFDPRDRHLWANVAATFALAATVFSVLAVGTWIIGLLVGNGLPLRTLLFISLSSGLSLAAIALVFSVATTYGSYRLGIDPDDTTIPIVTNVVDVFGMLLFLGIARWTLVG
ncbi:magnesium transporter [Halopenitus persicus]|uniref:MgtE-like transporter n=1 Tax=Halopenitus persicus TaxID=1048396 RepID=A0A1H3E264_9EURY|nr:magnesium transporter [Halopenitus persicus]QHS16467.1 ABC transporter permease [haloarchaeon 3A1-DGR]SDX72771.1 mgtE-like transporter [Halopenitus persicus]